MADPGDVQLKRWIENDTKVVERYRSIAMDPRPVIYTAIFGGYDTLRRPRIALPGIRLVAFTDTPEAIPEPWEVLYMAADCHTMQNRMVKILGHRAFADATKLCYIDGNFQIMRNPFDALGEDELVVFDSWHEKWSVADELSAVLDRRLACAETATRQIESYCRAGFSPEDHRCARCGLLLRRNTLDLAQRFEAWWLELRRWTHRDQLSFHYVMQGQPFRRMNRSERARYFKRAEHNQHRKVW